MVSKDAPRSVLPKYQIISTPISTKLTRYMLFPYVTNNKVT